MYRNLSFFLSRARKRGVSLLSRTRKSYALFTLIILGQHRLRQPHSPWRLSALFDGRLPGCCCERASVRSLGFFFVFFVFPLTTFTRLTIQFALTFHSFVLL